MKVLAVRDDGAQLAAEPDMFYGVLITPDGTGILPVASALAHGDWHDGTGTADVSPDLENKAIQASAERDQLESLFRFRDAAEPVTKVGPHGYVHGWHYVGLSQSDFKDPEHQTNEEVTDQAIDSVANRWNVSDDDVRALANEDGIPTQGLSGLDLRRQVAGNALQRWQGSSGGPIPTAAVTHIAEKQGRSYNLANNEQVSQDFIRSRPALDRATRSLGDAIYSGTQDWLAARGIDHVKLLRASHDPVRDESRPFTSWSTDWGGVRHEPGATEREAVVPAARIFSVPPTGFGTLAESEVVLLPPGTAEKSAKSAEPTAAAFLLIRAQNDKGKWRYLLQKRTDGTWGLPGGGLHPGEDPWEGAVRESSEELGDLPGDLEPQLTLVRDTDDDLEVHTFVVDLPQMFSPSMDGDTPEETEGWGWFSKKEIPDLPLHPEFEKTWDSVHWGELGKFADGDLVKVGPKGYIHGWIYVGPEAKGTLVDHPEHGSGTVHASSTHHHTVVVKYRDGTQRTYDAQFDESARPHFETGHKPDEPLTGIPAIEAVPAAGRFNLSDIRRDSSVPERVVAYYSSRGNLEVNSALRTSNGDLGKIESENSQLGYNISVLDSIMGKSPLSHSVTTSRGVDSGAAVFGKAWRENSSMNGASWIDDAFTSTSMDPKVAEDFTSDYSGYKALGLIMNITSPPGIHAITTSDDNGSSEGELLLERGLKYTVTGDNIGTNPDTRELDVMASQP